MLQVAPLVIVVVAVPVCSEADTVGDAETVCVVSAKPVCEEEVELTVGDAIVEDDGPLSVVVDDMEVVGPPLLPLLPPVRVPTERI